MSRPTACLFGMYLDLITMEGRVAQYDLEKFFLLYYGESIVIHSAVQDMLATLTLLLSF